MKDIRLAAILAAPIILAVLLAVAASDPYTGYPEGTRPTPNQDGNRSLSKINSLLYGTNGTGLKVQGTFSATNITVTNLWGITTVDSANPLPVTGLMGSTNASQSHIGATNDTSTALYLQPSTNQVSFCLSPYSLGNNTTTAGVVTNAAWATTNAAFNVAGGSGVLTDLEIISSTNRDYCITIYPKVITAPTIQSAFLPTRAAMQGMKGPWTTTNTLYCSEWQIVGTNFVKRMNIGCAMKNADSSQNLMIVATYLDTKADVSANSIQVNVGFINDK